MDPKTNSRTIKFSSKGVSFSQYTDSDLCSSNQEPSFAPSRFLPSKDLASAAEIRSPRFLNGAPKALVNDQPTHHHYVHCSLNSSDTRSSWPNTSFELSQSQYSMRAAFVQLAENLEKTQVLQSLSIVQDYMAKHPSIFESQDPEMVERWMLNIESVISAGSLSE